MRIGGLGFFLQAVHNKPTCWFPIWNRGPKLGEALICFLEFIAYLYVRVPREENSPSFPFLFGYTRLEVRQLGCPVLSGPLYTLDPFEA